MAIKQIKPRFSQEQKVLLEMIAVFLSGEKKQNSIQTDLNIDWKKFLKLSIALKTAPICYLGSMHSGMNLYMPEKIINSLKQLYTINTRRNLQLLAYLIRICRELKKENIKLIPLKGPLFSERIFGSIGAKVCDDLDILIQKQDYVNVKKTLYKIGFKNIPGFYSESFVMDFLRHRPFFHPKLPDAAYFHLEVHWNFYTQYTQAYDMDSVWRTAVLKDHKQEKYSELSPPQMLLHIAISLRVHGFHEFKKFIDFYAVLQKYQKILNWNEVIRLAFKNKQRSALYLSLYYIELLFNYPVPAHVFSLLKPGWLPKKIVGILVKPERIVSLSKKEKKIIYSDIINFISADSFMDALKIVFKTVLAFPVSMQARYKFRRRS